jgi:N-methylhydantoinase A
MPHTLRIGIDTGGTFTDFLVQHPDGNLSSFKLPSNPADPSAVILAGIERAAQSKQAEILHGSTVATNALLERKGASTAFLTTAGFEDLLLIGRQNRAELYNLSPVPKPPLIPREYCHGIAERTHADGSVSLRPDPKKVAKLAQKLKKRGIRSVAICFLHGWQVTENEQAVADALGEDFYLSVSHDVAPEFREFERASTTAVNAYVGPLMDAYLGRLEQNLKLPLSIMQSNGGLLPAAAARRHAVRTILSGPAGGVIGAMGAARAAGFENILGFDMGGTSTDVSLSEGGARETTEAYVDALPIRVPMLDIHTVGAGGGSIARVDAGGLLRVGPESAGANPGPACYGHGDLPTVTDAHVVLGRIAPDQLAGGELHIDPARAARAVERIATSLSISLPAAAAGILRVANSNMERAIRAVSVERGFDPRRFALVAFGGAGGLHACEIAHALGIETVIVPQFAGALSALGMLMAPRTRDFAAGVLGRANHKQTYEELERGASAAMPKASLERFADLRYAGQSYEITVPENADFHAAHKQAYGFDIPGRPIETVSLRVRATLPTTPPQLIHPGRRKPQLRTRQIHLASKPQPVPVYQRAEVPARVKQGPALVLDYGSTTLIPPNWRFHTDKSGALIATFVR